MTNRSKICARLYGE